MKEGYTEDDNINRRIMRILKGENVPLMVSNNTVMNTESADILCVTKAALDGCLVDFLENNRVSIDVLSKILMQKTTLELENVLQVDHIFFHDNNLLINSKCT